MDFILRSAALIARIIMPAINVITPSENNTDVRMINNPLAFESIKLSLEI
jgi:hypothetical protein